MLLEDKMVSSIKKQENTYIYSIDASHLYKAMTSDVKDREGNIISSKGNYVSKKGDSNKLFIATIPYSIEILRLDEYYPKEIYLKNSKQYTKSIINVTFDENCIEFRDKINSSTGEKILDIEGNVVREKYLIKKKKGMRKHLYKKGFSIDGQKYIFYKRGASKARTGSCLFIKENMYETLMNRSRLIHNKTKEQIKNKEGLFFDTGEKCDITSLNAYQSLTLSGIEDIIEIDPKSILIIDDIDSLPFEVESSVTREVNGVLVTKNEKVTRVNNMTDGQGLADESLFEKVGREHKGMMLLRSDLFKCCAFNTKLQQFFKHMDNIGMIKGGKIKDKYRGWVDYKDILLVTTPSSVKFLKFKYKFKSEEECYNDWYSNIDNVFGIVKSDKEGNYGTWNRSTYQIINSMPFTKEQLKEIMQPELDYIKLLKTDIAYFKNHIALKESATKNLEKDMGLINWDNEEDFKSEKDNYSSGEMINNILAINSDFQHTNVFKKYRLNQIKCYVEELRKGKIRLENTIYSTIVANPYEMLLHSIGKYNDECLAKGREIYCKFYEDGKDLATFRNPHINSGNVMIANNRWHDEYKWFNLSNNITIVNVSDNDFPDRGQGFDFDSDTLLHIPNEIFVQVAKECQKYKTPLNMVKGDSKVRLNTPEDLAELDDVLSNNFIGKIINKSQIINSYMWDCVCKNMDKELIEKLYNTSSMLSSLSQIELDKAKKSFDNISMTKELKKINNIKHKGKNIINFEIEYLYEEIVDENTGEVTKVNQLNSNGSRKCVKRMIVPKFFNYVAFDNSYRTITKFNTPMDYLEEIIDSCRCRNPKKTKTIGELIIKPKNLEGDISRARHIKPILDICKKHNGKMCYVRMNKQIKSENAINIIKASKENAINEVGNISLSAKTIYTIINKCFSDTKKDAEWAKIGMVVLLILYNSKHKLKLLSIFKNINNINEKILIPNEDGDINIFGIKYNKMVRKDVISA